MKNAIYYYYNLTPNEIHQINKKIKFTIKNKKYILEPIKKRLEEIQEIFELQYYLTRIGFMNNIIILNLSKQIVTKINNSDYILTETIQNTKKIEINDILIFNNINIEKNKFNKLKRDDWYNLWIRKIDYLEYQINQFGKKYKLISENSAYYIGLAENSIQLLANIEKNNIRLTIAHNRTYKTTTKDEYYNPINFIIDSIVRDISEYIKDCIINDIEIEEILDKYVYYNKLNENEIKMMFIRILYPSYYIDMCEKIIEGQIEEKELKKIIDKTENIEQNIKKIYIKLKKITTLPEIEWLTN